MLVKIERQQSLPQDIGRSRIDASVENISSQDDK